MAEALAAPVEVAAQLYSALNEPKPTSIDFSQSGELFLSSHGDDAVRLADVNALNHVETYHFDTFGVHQACFTQGDGLVCVAPRFPLDGHLHLLNLETAQLVGALAYLNDVEGEIRPIKNMPVYTSLSQCPTTDVLAAVVSSRRQLAFFHPMVSGAIACSSPRSIHGKATVVFGRDGNTFVVGDDAKVVLFDRRRLCDEPVCRINCSRIFSSDGSAPRCKGIDANVDGSRLLLTSSLGEVLAYNYKTNAVEINYFHDDAKRHFIGCGDAIGAKYVAPGLADSDVVQSTSAMVGGRHLLVYGGETSTATTTHEDALALPKPGLLKLEMQSKDSDVPVALAVNPRYRLVATAARSITWWAM